MTTLQEAARKALCKLEEVANGEEYGRLTETIDELRATLAQQGEPVDRSDAVNLARNIINESWTNEDVTTRGVRLLADAVLLMDTSLQSAQPVGINGLTEAETNASMSVFGLSAPQL